MADTITTGVDRLENWIWTAKEGVHNQISGAHFDPEQPTERGIADWVEHYRGKNWWTPAHEAHIVGLYRKHNKVRS